MNKTIDSRINEVISESEYLEELADFASGDALLALHRVRLSTLELLDGDISKEYFDEFAYECKQIALSKVAETRNYHEKASGLCDSLDDIFGGADANPTPEQRVKGGRALVHLLDIQSHARLAEETLEGINILRNIAGFAVKEG